MKVNTDTTVAQIKPNRQQQSTRQLQSSSYKTNPTRTKLSTKVSRAAKKTYTWSKSIKQSHKLNKKNFQQTLLLLNK